MKRRTLAPALLLVLAGGNAAAGSIIFIGNSFTYGQGSALRFYGSGVRLEKHLVRNTRLVGE
jgi:hypothetical protein